MAAPDTDLIILGGGLSGGLCALALAQRRPELSVTIIEPGERLGGNHLWSFFDSDVARSDLPLVEPLISHRWDSYEVRFPTHGRKLAQAYRTIASERLDGAVRRALPAERIIRAAATDVGPREVVLEDGRTLNARAVLDARGGKAEGLRLGWQKFLGQLLRIPQGHGLTEPVVMDATVDQADGYRFVYLLPFSPTELFVEDTYYTDGAELDRDLLRDRIGDYAAERGWQVAERTREETGQLPVLTGGDFERFWPASDPVARAGARGGFFHPLTSYSLPDAVRFASWLADELPLDRLAQATRERARRHWRRSAYDRFLARMLFRAADPPHRYRVLQRFYRLPAPLIARFYAGKSTAFDRVRILAGRPPVSIWRAMRALKDSE
ncbi:lycopene beta-cyclase CrtY [Sphingomonas sp. BN140010]|uniref:Lycopene beta-cyclase CrtY n=1 Tax=Sphingomonas arvum TaxID=2992113 RepID=A0ABT3JC56_9SPHN|nr:lycopene beta-cyclase CrtY [Sphingomonas sp. BN140010]MCW3796653.1 lycopene beta-cyclase CrtY [Sphingomonas sp. BN140010]